MKANAGLALTAFVAAAVAGTASAETQKSFSVAAVIATGCAITTAGGGTWGDISLGSVNGLTTGTIQADLLSGSASGIQLNCTPGTTVNITADNGNNAVASVRQLVYATNATSLIPYLLYANGSATAWTTQAIPLSFVVGTSQQIFPVRAKATLSGPTRAGAYSDTVRVTVSW
jgi:spore coat protein U-like protein